MRRSPLVVLALALVLVLPELASAHSIIRVRGSDVSYTSSDATSLNQLTIRDRGTDIEFRDPTVDGGIDYGSCVPGETNAKGEIIQAFCPRGGLALVRVDLGEREDTLDLTVGLPTQAIGGPGADRVVTAGGADIVVGNEGNDDLRSGPGNDNVLAGDGDDVVVAADGNDQVQGGGGADRIDSGPGDDDIRVRDGTRDVLACGDGNDTVDADSLDDVGADCERVTRHETAAAPGTPDQPRTTTPTGQTAGVAAADRDAPRVRAGALTLQRLRSSGRIRVHATSTEAGSVAASGYVSIGGLRFALKTVRAPVGLDGGGASLDLALSKATLRKARSALRRRKRVSVVLGVVATDRAGNSAETKAPVIRLRR